MTGPFESNTSLVDVEGRSLFARFREYAVAFEKNTFERQDREAQPLFPLEFRRFVEQKCKT